MRSSTNYARPLMFAKTLFQSRKFELYNFITDVSFKQIGFRVQQGSQSDYVPFMRVWSGPGAAQDRGEKVLLRLYNPIRDDQGKYLLFYFQCQGNSTSSLGTRIVSQCWSIAKRRREG